MNIIFDVNESLAKLSNVLNSAKSMYMDTTDMDYGIACKCNFDDINEDIDIYISSKIYDYITYNFDLDLYCRKDCLCCRNFMAIANKIKEKVSSVTIIYESFEMYRVDFLKTFFKHIFSKVSKTDFRELKYLNNDASCKDLKSKIEDKNLYRDFCYDNYTILKDFVDKLKDSYKKDTSKIFADAKEKNIGVSADFVDGRLSAFRDVLFMLKELYIDPFDDDEKQ